MESSEQNKQIINILTDLENRLTAVRGKGLGRLSEKGEGIQQKENLIDTDSSMVITKGKGGGGRKKRVKGG